MAAGPLTLQTIMTEKHKGKELPPITPTEAVAEAMVWAYAQNFKKTRRTGRIFLDTFDQVRRPVHEKVQSLTSALTRELCETNSVYVLCFLFQKYPHLFNRYFLLESRIDEEVDLQFRNTDWYRHVCFLVQDVNSVFHAGSPANYDTWSGKYSLNRFFTSSSLAKILVQIQAYELGVWPSLEFIEHLLQQDNTGNSIAITKSQDNPDVHTIRIATIYRPLRNKQPYVNNEKHDVPILPTGQFLDPIYF